MATMTVLSTDKPTVNKNLILCLINAGASLNMQVNENKSLNALKL